MISASPLQADLEHVLRHTETLWTELRDTRIFITGGTGFFGRWLLESFVEANRVLDLRATAIVLTRNPEKFKESSPHLAGDPSIQLAQGDVRTFDLSRGELPLIIHGAAESGTSFGADRPADMHSVIVDGTERVLELAARSRTSKLLFISSGAVYGRQPVGVPNLAEDEYPGSLPDESPGYATGKRAGERLCNSAARGGIETKIARCFAFVGPYLPLDAHFAIGNFIRAQVTGKPIQVQSDGSAVRSYLYASDLTIWLWSILIRGASGRPYNVGSEEAISIGDLARLIGAYSSPPLSVIIRDLPDPTALPHRYVPSTARARSELGLEQRIGLQDAIKSTISWSRLRAAANHN